MVQPLMPRSTCLGRDLLSIRVEGRIQGISLHKLDVAWASGAAPFEDTGDPESKGADYVQLQS